MAANRVVRRLAWGLALLLAAAGGFWVLRNPEHTTLSAELRQGSGLQFADLPSGVTHYEVGGPAGGQPVVLVHGFSVPAYIWDSTFTALAAAGFRVVRYDLLGRGWSDRPRAEYTARLFGQQLLELLNALGLERPVDIVGLSAGGWITASFATWMPERIRSVTLVDPAAGPRGDLGVLGWPVIGSYLWQTTQVPGMADGQFSDFVHPERFPDWADRYRPQMQYRGFGRALHSTVLALVATDMDSVYAAFGRTGIRTLLVWGREDQTVPFPLSTSVREAIPNLTFVPVDSAGHLPHLERADFVTPILIDFLRHGVGSDSSRAAALAAARQVIGAARYASMVTLGSGGQPQARVVDPFAPGPDFSVMVATNARTRKAAEIARDPRVTLLYFDTGGASYVTLMGLAELVRDSTERARWWKEEWASFYQNRNLGDDYLLIRIRPFRLEISSEWQGIHNDPVTWQPVIVELP